MYGVLILRATDPGRREKWRGCSSGGTDTAAGRIISIEGVSVCGARGYHYSRQNTQKMKWELYSYSNWDKSQCACTLFNYGGSVYLCLLQRQLDMAVKAFCMAEHQKSLVCYWPDNLRPVFVLLGGWGGQMKNIYIGNVGDTNTPAPIWSTAYGFWNLSFSLFHPTVSFLSPHEQ